MDDIKISENEEIKENKKNKKNSLMANIVRVLHLILVVLIIVTPFLNYNRYLLLYLICIPFIILHWLTNNDICVLTLLEKKLRGKNENEDKEYFTEQLISPVFTFANDHKQFSLFTYGTVIILWSIAFSKLLFVFKTNEIKNVFDAINLLAD